MGYEVEFLPVGDSNGDAICVRYGDDQNGYTIHVVDGGFKDTSDTVIKHIEQYYGEDAKIDNMILSHADNDHAVGLIGVLEHFEVGAIWMNRPWLYAEDTIDAFHGNYEVDGLIARMRELHPYLVTIEDIAKKRNIPIHAVFQGTNIGKFHILAPTKERYLSLIPELDKTPTSYVADAVKTAGTILAEALRKVGDWISEKWGSETLSDSLNTSASNETCLVQMGFFEERRVVLTADVGPIGLNEAADYAAANNNLAPPRFMQVPHHGSRHNVSKTALNRWLGDPLPDQTSTKRGTAFCSVGADEDKYPRRVVSNAFLRRGYPVVSTKGQTIRHSHNMPERGWSGVEAAPFYTEVEA